MPAGLLTVDLINSGHDNSFQFRHWKKKVQIFLIYKKIQNGAIAKSYMTYGLLIQYMGKCLRISSYIRKPFFSSYMTLQLLHSEFPYKWGKYKCIPRPEYHAITSHARPRSVRVTTLVLFLLPLVCMASAVGHNASYSFCPAWILCIPLHLMGWDQREGMGALEYWHGSLTVFCNTNALTCRKAAAEQFLWEKPVRQALFEFPSQ